MVERNGQSDGCELLHLNHVVPLGFLVNMFSKWVIGTVGWLGVIHFSHHGL